MAKLYDLPPISLSFHRICNLDEPSDVSTKQQAGQDIASSGFFAGPLFTRAETDLQAMRTRYRQ